MNLFRRIILISAVVLIAANAAGCNQKKNSSSQPQASTSESSVQQSENKENNLKLSGNFGYINNGGNIKIVYYKGANQVNGEIVVPETIDGCPVTAIQERVFTDLSKIVKVTLPQSLTSMGKYVFNNCSSLTEITIPDGITAIEEGTFKYCRSLTKVNLPAKLITIDSYAFAGCSALSQIIFPDGLDNVKLDKINAYAFANCISLNSIEFPITVSSRSDQALDPNAFAGCINLKKSNIDLKALNINSETTYGITGTFTGCEEWTKDLPMSDDDKDKVYICTIPDVEPGTYEFKVRSNENWTDSWGDEENGKTYNSQMNYFINPTEKCSVYIEFNTNNENWDHWVVKYQIIKQ